MDRKNKLIMAFAIFLLLLSLNYLIMSLRLNKISMCEENHDLTKPITFVSNRIDKSEELYKLIDEFEDLNPDIDVKLELIGDAEEILARKASVGELSDVTLVPSCINEKQFAKYFLPINDLGFTKDNIYNYYLGTDRDNNLYALGTSLSWLGVIYNKNIFKQCNINEIPLTNAELLKDCEKIKKSEIIPIALNYKQSWIMESWINTIPITINNEFERKILNNEYGILDEKSELYKSINLARSIYINGYCEKDILSYEWNGCKEDIKNGKVAMIILNSDFINQFVDLGMNKDELGIFPIPETNEIHVGGDYRIAVSKNTKYPNEAKLFLKFLFEKDRYANAVGIMSILKDSENSKKFLKQTEEFNIPIKFQGDIDIEEKEEDKEKHYEYLELRNKLGINYKLIQEYIICENTNDFRNKLNEEFKKYSKE